MINRRQFIEKATSFMVPLTLSGIGMKAYTKDSKIVQSLRKAAVINEDKILVMINMNGGNDGLNTVIPLDQYGAYQGLRSNIAINQNYVLPLAGTNATGLHPSLGGLQSLYNEGKLSIVHSVSYPNPNQSHFRSSDIWMTGVDAESYSNTGWMGRYLENRYNGYPNGYPNTTMEDPIALQIGYMGTPTLQGSSQNVAITIDSPDNFYNLIGSAEALPPQNLPPNAIGQQIQYVRLQQALAVGYASEIKKAADLGKNLGTYPVASEKNYLADQLKIVARLINGGLKTKIFFVSQGGFDTHSTQVDATDTRQGKHASLLKELSDAISAFQKDIQLLGHADKVLGMTFSEFGRRANSNNSRGTDHGVAAPMFIFGNGIKKQQIGVNPDLTNGLLPTNPQSWETYRDIKMQIDFRRVYGDILVDWFGVSQDNSDSLLFKNFKTTSVLRDTIETIEGGSWNDCCTWSAGRKPLTTEKAIIKANHVVNVNTDVSARTLVNEGNLNILAGGKVNLKE